MKNKPKVRIRRWILVALMLLVFGIFTAQLLQIQIVDSEKYKESMEGIISSSQMRKATRGEIMDRNGNPIVVNEMGHSIILDRPFLPRGAEQNNVILRLMELFEELGEEWTDNLPISYTEPYEFLEGREEDKLRLQNHLETQPYATADEMMYWLVDRYGLEDYTPLEARQLAGVRYEMERRDFSNKIPYTFAEDVSIESVIHIKERSFDLPGVSPQSKAIRKFAVDDLAPHILGQVGPLYAEEYQQLKEEGKIFKEDAPQFDTEGYTMDDTIGKGGIEEALEDTLRGSNGKREISMEAGGEVVEYYDAIEPEPGNTVYLTLDENLQRLLQDSLEAQIKYLQTDSPEIKARNADAGAAVVLEVKTGKILATATYPTYTLTDYKTNYEEVAGREGDVLLDRALLGSYAPGSIYKPVTALAGLSSGIATPQSTFHCGGVYEFFAPSYRPRCLGVHGNINVVRALRESCNIYFYEAGRQAGIETIDNVAKDLGLGEPTGIEVKEYPGQRVNPEVKKKMTGEDWYPADTVQVAIGQFDNKFSPLQLANYAATIANRGKRMKLSVVDQVRDYGGEEIVEQFTPEVVSEMEYVTEEMWDAVFQGMVEASHVGTARGTFGNYPISVASKTGTPEIGNDEVNSTFMAFAPAEDPEIAVLVVIEKGWHGYTGASVTKAIFDEYFGIEDVWAPVLNGPDILKRERLAEAAADGTEEEKTSPYSSYVPREDFIEEPAPPTETAPEPSAENVPEESVVEVPPEPSVEEKETPAESSQPPPRREGEPDGDVNLPPKPTSPSDDD